jgi:hypothetical protein
VLGIISGCAPDAATVEGDFLAIVERNTESGVTALITDIRTIEGDSQTCYKLVSFDLRIDREIDSHLGWFADRKIQGGTILQGGKVEMRYQGGWFDDWQVRSHRVVQLPSPVAHARPEGVQNGDLGAISGGKNGSQ